MKKRGGYLSIVLMILFCGSCRDLFPVQVRQGNFHEVRDSMRVDGKRVLILLASGDCNVCKATKDDWAGDKELVEKLNRDYRVWQLEITDEKNALIPQVLRSLSTPTLIIADSSMRIEYLHTGFIGAEGLSSVLQLLERGQNVPPRLNIPLYTSYSSDFYSFFENVLQAAFQLTCPDTDTIILQNGMLRVKKSLDTEPYFMNLYLGWRYCTFFGDDKQAFEYKERALRNLDDLDKLLYCEYLAQMEFGETRETNGEKKRLFADQYDFTREPDDKETWFDIVYRNSFDSPIIISAIETSCNCLSFSWNRMPLLPGKAGVIRVKYKTTGEGRVYKKAYVFSNLPDSPHEIQLRCTNN